MEGGRDSQATLNLALRDRQRRRRRRHRHCPPLRPLRHLRASNSDPFSTREAKNEIEDPASRIKEANSRRRALLLSGAGLVLSTAASSSSSASPPSSSSQPSSSSSPPPASLDSIRSAYDRYSSDYDSLDGGALADLLGFTRLRRKAVSLARGKVLELAVGTGLSLPLYYEEEDSAAVTSLTAVDLSPGMLSVASKRVQALGLRAAGAAAAGSSSSSSSSPPPSPPRLLPPPVLVAADAAALPFADSAFDTVVDTFSLCVFPEPLKALKEARRVLEKQRGRLVVVEHSRAPPSNRALALYQDATAGLIAGSGGGGKGCVWNQDVPRLLREAGFEVEEEERVAGGTVGLFVCRVRR